MDQMDEFRKLLRAAHLAAIADLQQPLSQNEFAANVLGVAPASYSGWLTDDRRKPDPINAARLAMSRYIGPRIYDLFPELQRLVPIPEDATAAELEYIYRMVEQLGQGDRDAVRQTATG